MSRGYNRVILMGNLAKDPDVRYVGQTKTARITVAVGREWKDRQSGQKQSHTDFVSVVAWGFNADLCETYLRKGRPILVEGRVSVRDFDDSKTGQHRWVTEVVADNLILMPGGKREGGSAGPGGGDDFPPEDGPSGPGGPDMAPF